jgi:nicotinic acid mononucleotide adenylyltransferase
MQNLALLLAATIALLAAAMAWAQWYTARSRLILDLFNQRFEVYEGVCTVMARVMSAGITYTQDILDVGRQGDRAKFLFGDDVCRYLASLQKALSQLKYCQSVISQRKGDEQYHQAVEIQASLTSGAINTFHEDFDALVQPYMRMDHKRPMSWLLG